MSMKWNEKNRITFPVNTQNNILHQIARLVS